MRVRNKHLLRVIFILLISVISFVRIQAQPSPDDQNIDDPVTEDPGDPGHDPDLPIDSNILILLAVGVGYGLKKIYDQKRANKKVRKSLKNTIANYQDFVD